MHIWSWFRHVHPRSVVADRWPGCTFHRRQAHIGEYKICANRNCDNSGKRQEHRFHFSLLSVRLRDAEGSPDPNKVVSQIKLHLTAAIRPHPSAEITGQENSVKPSTGASTNAGVRKQRLIYSAGDASGWPAGLPSWLLNSANHRLWCSLAHWVSTSPLFMASKAPSIPTLPR